MAQTPLTVGSPQQVVERTLGFRSTSATTERQLFLIDHAGLPLTTVLEQLDLLGEVVADAARRDGEGPSRGRAGRADPRVAPGGGLGA